MNTTLDVDTDSRRVTTKVYFHNKEALVQFADEMATRSKPGFAWTMTITPGPLEDSYVGFVTIGSLDDTEKGTTISSSEPTNTSTENTHLDY